MRGEGACHSPGHKSPVALFCQRVHRWHLDSSMDLGIAEVRRMEVSYVWLEVLKRSELQPIG